MSAETVTGNPCIYALPAATALSAEHAKPWLAHAKKLGFDYLLATSQKIRADIGLLDDKGTVKELATACEKQKLKLLLDVHMASVDSDAPVLAEHPNWFLPLLDPNAVPDPRRPPPSNRARWRLHEPDVASAAAAWWQRQLSEALAAGASGFRLHSPEIADAPWWRELLQAVRKKHPQALFVAAAEGLDAADREALAEASFDHALGAVNHWDIRSSALERELAALSRVAPPLGMAAVPQPGSGLRHEDRDEDLSQLELLAGAHRRAAWLAAGCTRGWVMPAGFEFAVTHGDEPGESPANAARRGTIDVREEIGAINAWRHENSGDLPRVHADSASVAVWQPHAEQAQLLLINTRLDRHTNIHLADVAAGAPFAFGPWQPSEAQHSGGSALRLEAGEVRVLQAKAARAVTQRHIAAVRKQRLDQATAAPRVVIEAVTPCVDAGRFPVKRVVGDTVRVEADVFMDGHDVLAARVRYRAMDERNWREAPMRHLGNDRYVGDFTPDRMGRYEYAVTAWRNAWATYEHEVTVKHDAGQVIALEIEEGRRLVEAFADRAPSGARKTLKALIGKLRDGREDAACYELLIEPATHAAMEAADPRRTVSESAPLSLEVDRRAAQFASWYELFPRSQVDDAKDHGTLRDVIKRLPAIRDMGFDVLYFPPIHPIGTAFRKGPNNTLEPGPGDPGSPYAIGSPDGGHTDIHPQLGTIEDFRALRDAAHDHGLELALDFAIQCSPDHPWLKEHPGWFDWRPDGSIRYAENPPKKYQDIVNVDFYAKDAVPSLWQALCDAVLFWAREGVRIFRVDNPHTKPLPFWEWMIARVREQYPDALFLAEAFTRPKPMYALAKAGYNQSYTYFTWRHTKQEFTEYLTELADGLPKDFFRPNFFVNTPDINPYFLQTSGRSGFLIRAALATTLSGLWGMYSGFELCEATPMPGKEEYYDSEKYEVRPRDYTMPGNIIAEITQLNMIRRAHPALQSHLGVRFLHASNDQVLFFEKVSPSGRDRVLVAINLDPHHEQASDLSLPLGHWGVAEDAPLQVDNLLHDTTEIWRGGQQHIWLGSGMPYAIWQVHTGV